MKEKVKRNDDFLEKKWSAPRVVYDEVHPYRDPGIDFSDDPGQTDQSQAAELEIDFILKRFQQTGVLPGTDVQKVFADISDAPTYHEAMNIVLAAQDQFDSLDAHTRKRFQNDPAEFLAFATDPKNAQELVDMGLATPVAKDGATRIVEALEGLKTDSQPPSPAEPDPAPARRAKKHDASH